MKLIKAIEVIQDMKKLIDLIKDGKLEDHEVEELKETIGELIDDLIEVL